MFAAEFVIFGAHVFEDVTVADSGNFVRQIHLRQSLTEADVAHDGCHDGFVGQGVDFAHQLRANNHDVIAVDNFAAFVDAKAPVRVAVVSNADVRVIFEDFAPQIVQMCRAAAVVDVDAVGFVANQNQIRAETFKHGGHCFEGGTVGAIQNDFHAVEAFAGRAHDETDVIFQQILTAFDVTDFKTRRAIESFAAFDVANNLLNFVFDFVGEFVTVAAEKFNAVVLERVVRRADHNTRRRVKFSCQVSDGRRRDNARKYRVAARRTNARDKCRFEHFAADSSVAPD